MALRLRQVALVGDQYEETENALREVFGLDVAYRDPGNRPGREAGVSIFGLKNFVMPIGNQFLELVVPLEDGPTSAAGRYLQRRGGPGGYMLLFQVPRSEYGAHSEHLSEMGVRTVAGGDISETGSDAVHIHPKDLPGCLVELRWCENDEKDDGDWWPVEKDWRDHSNTEVAEAIVGAEVQTPEPLQLAQRWGEVLQQDVLTVNDAPSLSTADGPVRFVEPTDGRPEGLGGIDVKVRDPETVLRRAANFGLPVGENMVEISGLRFNLR